MSTAPKKAKAGSNPGDVPATEPGEETPGAGEGGESGEVVHSEEAGGLRSEPKYYFGTYVHSTDRKKRVQIPSTWRPKPMANSELTLMAWSCGGEGSEYCLLVLSRNELDRMMIALSQMSWGNDSAEVLKRSLGGEAQTVAFDQVGRICIPDRMAEMAGIEKDSKAVLVGVINGFQIWNANRFQNRRGKDGMRLPDAMKKLDEALKKPSTPS